MTPPESVAQAFDRYRTRVERVAARILRDPEEARDVASETFLAMLEKGPDDERASLAWLLASARNRALNRARDRARARRRPLEPIPDGCDEPPADPHAAALVDQALLRLSRRDRDALTLRFVEGLDHCDIGRRLGLSGASARVAVHRAVRRLRTETVLLLAAHHSAGRDCVRRLQRLAPAGGRPVHDGCRPCSAVAEEMAALSAHSILPVASLPLLRRAGNTLERLVSSLKPRLGGVEPRVVEAATALLIATGLVVTNGAAHLSASPSAGAPERTGVHVRGVSPAAIRRPVAAGVRTPALGRTPLLSDPEGDNTNDLLPPVPRELKVLGVGLRIPDGLGRRSDPGTDIRAFQTLTIAGARGTAESLLLRIGLAGPPPSEAGYRIDWIFARSTCTAGVSISVDRLERTAQMNVSCPSEDGGLEDWLSTEERPPTWWDVDLAPRIRGAVVEVPIRFASLPAELRRQFASGTRLTGIVVTSDGPSSTAGMVWTRHDRAPDDQDGSAYTIGT